MDHFKAAVVLVIGVSFTLPLLLDAETTTQTTTQSTTTTEYTGCKNWETKSPPSEHCDYYCGSQIVSAYNYLCSSGRKRTATGMVFKNIIN